jgi:hypothetical protein
MWLEIARALTYTFLHLSPVDVVGDETPDYGGLVRCAAKVCDVSPVLREYVLHRITRKWPSKSRYANAFLLVVVFVSCVFVCELSKSDAVCCLLPSNLSAVIVWAIVV